MHVRLRNLMLLSICCAAGCRYGDMYDQPRYEPFDASSFFDDGLSSRPLVDGVVPRHGDPARTLSQAYETGRSRDGEFVDELPIALDEALLRRGGNRFQIYCAICHGSDGAGRGTIVERGFSPPPALYDPKVVNQPVGYYYDVITHGHGAMYGYAARIGTPDRWAIAAFLRALQLSQRADIASLSDGDREKLQALPREPARNPEGTEHPR